LSQLDPKIKQRAEAMATANPLSMVGLFESDGTYVYVSPSHNPIMAFDPKEMVGRKLEEFIHPDDSEHTHLAFMDAVLNGHSIEVGVRIFNKSGRPVRVRATVEVVGNPASGNFYMLGMATPLPEEN
jgi:PAS domain S-box-containing protein